MATVVFVKLSQLDFISNSMAYTRPAQLCYYPMGASNHWIGIQMEWRMNERVNIQLCNWYCSIYVELPDVSLGLLSYYRGFKNKLALPICFLCPSMLLQIAQQIMIMGDLQSQGYGMSRMLWKMMGWQNLELDCQSLSFDSYLSTVTPRSHNLSSSLHYIMCDPSYCSYKLYSLPAQQQQIGSWDPIQGNPL